MKLFWKLFFATMLISTGCMVLCGCVLIHVNFQAQLEQEVETAQGYGEVVCHALAAELTSQPRLPTAQLTQQETGMTVARLAYALSVDVMNQRVPFAVLDAQGEVLFSSLPQPPDELLRASLGEGWGGWTIRRQGDSACIRSIRPVCYQNNRFFVETLRDISPLYQNQREQYELLLVMLAVMLAAAGLVTFLVVRLLLGQVVALSKITGTMADGRFGQRATPRGEDEIALLADNFNRMADCLEAKMTELQEEARRKELFVGAFSHELKTPLTSVIGYADLLRRKEMDFAQQHRCAHYIFSEGKRLEALSMRLLDLIVLQQHQLHRQPVEVSRLVAEVCALAAP